MLVEDISRNKYFYRFRISHVSRFISICDLFTDSVSYLNSRLKLFRRVFTFFRAMPIFKVSSLSFNFVIFRNFLIFCSYIHRFQPSKILVNSCTFHWISFRTLSYQTLSIVNMFMQTAPFTAQRFVQHFVFKWRYKTSFDLMLQLHNL
jgi:hypothetical protein